MVILGIDPGTRRIGYGLIRKTDGQIDFISAGIFNIKSSGDGAALKETRNELAALIVKHKPAILALEKLFFSKNQKTALAVAQARGVILLTAAENGTPVKEYSPNEVKLAVTGYGLSDKAAVFKMVKLILKTPKLQIIDDASDALALAITSCGDLFNYGGCS